MKLNEIQWKKWKVLDDGFVCLVDCMGDDYSVVQAARVSYGGGDTAKAGTKQVHNDRGLIRYLMRHHHTTPFEMAELKFLVRVPMDCWRQWIRHRTANVNEYSTRYSLAIDSCQTTPSDEWRLQTKGNRQGSSDNLTEWPEDVSPKHDSPGQYLTEREKELQKTARDVYQERIDLGIAREQARKDLPLSTYTEAYWKIDLHNLLHFLRLRMDPHAQKEICDYATTIGEKIVQPLFPLVWEAFVEYRMQSMNLTSLDIEVVKEMLKVTSGSTITERQFLRDQHHTWRGLKRCRERDECRDKLKRLGFTWVEDTKGDSNG